MNQLRRFPHLYRRRGGNYPRWGLWRVPADRAWQATLAQHRADSDKKGEYSEDSLTVKAHHQSRV
jgi:hypothetical protein